MIWTPTPSWKQGFARSAAESVNPGLWKGLVGLWSPALGPTGLTLRDVSGWGNHGTLTNMDPATDWVLGDPRSGGYALDYAAGTQHVALDFNYDLSQGGSVFGWVKYDSVASDASYAGVVDIGGGENSWQMWLDNASPDHFALGVYDSGWQVRYGSVVPVTGVWYHVGFTYVNSVAQMYVDGKPDGASLSAAMESHAIDWRLGQTTAGSKALNGRLGDVAVWDRAIRSSENQLLFERPKALVELRRPVYPPAVAAAGTILPHMMQLSS